jgi:hypothetical protein
MDNNNKDLGEMRMCGMDGIGMAWDSDMWWALMKTKINLQVPYNAGNFLSSCTIGDLTRTQLHAITY